MTPDPMAGDPAWQKIAGILALIFLLWNMRDGYRNGFWRKLVGLIALGAAWAGAYFFSDALAKIMESMLPYPLVLLRVLAGTLIALAVYAVVKSLRRLPRADKDDKGKPRPGLPGLLAGFLVGALWIVVLWSGVRFTATIAQCALRASGQPLAQSYAEHPKTAALIKLKASLDLGEAGRIAQAMDPMPAHFYRLSEKTIELLANPAACRALAKNPQLKPLLDDPTVVALTHDAEVQQLVREHNFHTLLRNERLRAAADNPQVQAKLKAIDVEAAIDAALAQAKAEQTAQTPEAQTKAPPTQ